tara:strand:+ start:738 stop:917 length:180 start_codon:yes stop_codon:yes gene_type:complete
MRVNKTLYTKDSGAERLVINSVDVKELLESGFYFESEEEAKGKEVKPVVTAKKSDKPSK